MAKYVKFLRGNPQTFIELENKNDDTLYFIYEEDKNFGELYLGARLIASGKSIVNTATLSGLQDILFESELDANDCLIYDITKNKWVNKPITDILPIFVGTNGEAGQIAGLVPATAGTNPNLFLRSDGSWSEVVSASDALVKQTILASNESHLDAIIRVTENNLLNKGDIVVVKELFFEQDENQHYQLTSYVYDGNNWVAMNGNYNAENVYFDEDFIFTNTVGTVVIPESGSIKVDAAGMNLKEFFTNLFTKEKDPEIITEVGATISLRGIESDEVGKEYTPSYKITFEKGAYSYGPDTNITATYEVTDNNGGSSTTIVGKLPSFIMSDDTDYKIHAVINYTEGATPVSNLGNPVESKKIPSGTIELDANSVKGYRNAFYGTLTNKNELTSDIIRGLENKSNGNVSVGSKMILNIPVGAMRIVFAYDATLPDLSEILDKNDFNSNIVSGFGKPKIIAVEGANGYQAIDYKVFVLDFAYPYDASNIFTATI